jgi:hypothetical protein
VIFCAFGRSRLQDSRLMREYTGFAHPYGLLLRKRPQYGDTAEVRKNEDGIEDTSHRSKKRREV